MVYVIKQFETTNYLKLNLVGLSILETSKALALEYFTSQKPVQDTCYRDLYYDVLGSDDSKYRLKFCDTTSYTSNYKYATTTYKAYNLLKENASTDLDYLDSHNLKLLKGYLKEETYYWDLNYVETLISGLSDDGLDKLMLGNFNYVWPNWG